MAKEEQRKTPEENPRRSCRPLLATYACDLLVVVEAALARFIVALAALVRAGRIAPAHRLGDFATRRVESAGCRGSAREVGTPVAHRAAVARAGRRTAVTPAATGWTAAAATAAIATATAATTAITTAATFTAAAATTVGRARTARTEAGTIAATATFTAAATAKSTAAATTTGLALDGFTDRDRAAVEQCTVHGLHGRGTLVVGFHFEEREAAAAASLAIRDHFR